MLINNATAARNGLIVAAAALEDLMSFFFRPLLYAMSKYRTRLIVVAKLKLLFSNDSSETLNCRLLALTTALTES